MRSSLIVMTLCLTLFQVPASNGIQPLDYGRLQQAADFAAKGYDGLLEHTMLAGVRMKASDLAGVQDDVARAWLKTAHDAPFDVFVDTPFSRAVFEALEGRKFNASDADRLNAGKIVAVVSHGKSRLPPSIIQDVLIERAGETIRPLKRELEDTVVRTHLDDVFPSVEGRFTFDFAAFEPTWPITLVLIGKEVTFRWDLTTQELALLR